MAKKKLTRAETIARISPSEISRLKGEEGRKILIGYVRTMQSAYKKRVSSFRRNNLVSYAQIAFEDSYKESKKVPLTLMSRNQLLLHFFRYSTFFNSATATKEGIIEIQLKEDSRIFGTHSKGRPNYRMNYKERTLFWSVYSEFKNQFPADINQLYSSESVQQYIADALFGKKSRVSPENFVDLLSSVRDDLQAKKLEEDMSDVPNVFSGRGNPFDF